MTNLLQVAIIFAVAWVEWYVYGKKGDALIDRAPRLIFWACLEVILGIVTGYVLVDIFISHDLWRLATITAATVVGCAGGIATSSVIRWSK